MSQHTLRHAHELIAAGFVPAGSQEALAAVIERFSLAITPVMATLIDRNDPDDPIARQFVPQSAELLLAPEELADPTDDLPFSPVKGLVHRYPDRVLLKPTHTCPIYCRFCFRREMVGAGGEALTETELEAVYEYIRGRPAIWEVVVSGGDPWILSPRRLRTMMAALGAIPHVAIVRFHTRVPIVDPGRVTEELVAALDSDKSVWVVIHANHPRELTDAARQACKKLRCAGFPLLSQSTLLKGVNDDARVLTALFRSLVTMGVKPYYLHQGDLAHGTSHFRTTIETGQALMKELRGRVSGICQPTFVLDLPHAGGKVPIGPSYAAPIDGTPAWRIEDIAGQGHRYPPLVDPAHLAKENV